MILYADISATFLSNQIHQSSSVRQGHFQDGEDGGDTAPPDILPAVRYAPGTCNLFLLTPTRCHGHGGTPGPVALVGNPGRYPAVLGGGSDERLPLERTLRLVRWLPCSLARTKCQRYGAFRNKALFAARLLPRPTNAYRGEL